MFSHSSEPTPNSEAAIDRACYFASRIHNDPHNEKTNQELHLWLQSNPTHQQIWQKIQQMEGAFSTLHKHQNVSLHTLNSAAIKRKQKRKKHTVAASLCALTLVASGVFVQQNPALLSDYKTATAQQKQLNLSDGSILYINSNSALDIHNHNNAITIALYKGEIFVDSSAAPSNNKPRITTEQGMFQPVGTRFNISLQPKATLLDVNKGKVQIRTAYTALIAKAKQRWQVTEQNVSLLSHNGLTAGAWVDNMIEADNARLGDVLNALAKHHKGWLQYNEQVSELRVSGVFYTSDIHSALQALENSLPIEISTFTPWVINIKQK